MSESFLRSAEIILIPKAGEAKTFAGLRTAFNISKTSEAAPNTAHIQVYNLSRESRTLFEQKENKIMLMGGYSSASLATGAVLHMLFIGDVTRAAPKRMGADVIMEIECGDGAVGYTESTMNKSYPGGTPLAAIIGDLKAQFGLKGILPGKTEGIPETTIQHGFVASGPTREVIDKVARSFELEWSIQDGNLTIVKRDTPTEPTAVLLTPLTGLVGSPTKKNEGVLATSLLNAELRPGRIVQLESEFVKGSFIARRVDHKGDTHSGPWHSELELQSGASV